MRPNRPHISSDIRQCQRARKQNQPVAHHLVAPLANPFPNFRLLSSALRRLPATGAVCSASVRGYLRITSRLRKRLFHFSRRFLAQEPKSPAFIDPRQNGARNRNPEKLPAGRIVARTGHQTKEIQRPPPLTPDSPDETTGIEPPEEHPRPARGESRPCGAVRCPVIPGRGNHRAGAPRSDGHPPDGGRKLARACAALARRKP